MTKTAMLCAAMACAMVAESSEAPSLMTPAHDGKTFKVPWQDESVSSINRLPARSAVRPCSKDGREYVLSLDGEWDVEWKNGCESALVALKRTSIRFGVDSAGADRANVTDSGKRAETFVACHLLKAVEGWTDLGYGDFSLGYLRDKSRREVDFVVVRDGEPWFLVEVKKSEESLSDALGFFQRRLGATHAFQVVLDADYEDLDCFANNEPTVVPARTFLSQLV